MYIQKAASEKLAQQQESILESYDVQRHNLLKVVRGK